MNKVFRYTAAACVAATLLWSVQARPTAQDNPDNDEPEYIERSYDTRGMSWADAQIAPRTGAIRDVLAPDRLLIEDSGHADNEWHMRDSGAEAMVWEDPYEAMLYALAFVDGDNRNYKFVGVEGHQVRVSAPEKLHDRLAWAMKALRDVADARVSVTVRRLAGDSTAPARVAANELVPAQKDSRLVGTMTGGLCDPLVLQRIDRRQCIVDFECTVAEDTVAYTPVVREVATGSEIVVGVISLPDGTLWVQGWHAQMEWQGARKLMTSGGEVELPELAYSWTPVSGVIANGGGLVIDSGEGNRFLVSASCDRVIRDHALKLEDGSELRLLNMTGILRSTALSTRWLMEPRTTEVFGEASWPQVFMDGPEDGPYNDSAIYVAENWRIDEVEVHVVGPLLGVQLPATGEDELTDAQRQAAEKLLTNRETTDRCVLRVSTFEVADDAALPAGVLQGRPSATDMQELTALAGKAGLSRELLLRHGHLLDLLELQFSNHVRSYDANSAKGVSALDPVIATIVTGTQLRLSANPVAEGVLNVSLRAGVTTGDAGFEQVNGAGGWKVERKRCAVTQAHFNQDLKVGEKCATVCPGPGPTGRLVVIVVERIS